VVTIGDGEGVARDEGWPQATRTMRATMPAARSM